MRRIKDQFHAICQHARTCFSHVESCFPEKNEQQAHIFVLSRLVEHCNASAKAGDQLIDGAESSLMAAEQATFARVAQRLLTSKYQREQVLGFVGERFVFKDAVKAAMKDQEYEGYKKALKAEKRNLGCGAVDEWEDEVAELTAAVAAAQEAYREKRAEVRERIRELDRDDEAAIAGATAEQAAAEKEWRTLQEELRELRQTRQDARAKAAEGERTLGDIESAISNLSGSIETVGYEEVRMTVKDNIDRAITVF